MIGDHNHKVSRMLLELPRFEMLEEVVVRKALGREGQQALRCHKGITRLHLQQEHFPETEEDKISLLPSMESLANIKVLRVVDLFLPTKQLAQLLSHIIYEKLTLESLTLIRNYSKTHDNSLIGNMRDLGQASQKLSKLSVNIAQVGARETRYFFEGVAYSGSSLKELVLSNLPNSSLRHTDLGSLIQALQITSISTLVLNSINLDQEQARNLFEKIQQGATKLKNMSIFFESFNNRNNHNQVRALDASLLAGALNRLEKVVLGNVNLSSEQVEAVLRGALGGTELRELRVDR